MAVMLGVSTACRLASEASHMLVMWSNSCTQPVAASILSEAQLGVCMLQSASVVHWLCMMSLGAHSAWLLAGWIH